MEVLKVNLTSKRNALFLLVACSAALLCPLALHAEQMQAGVVMRGTAYETKYYIKTGEQPGPVVFVIGGVHGNETAGYLAARKLVHWTITSGTLVVIPDANVQAIRRNVRFYLGNMNAMFPGDPKGDANHRLAYEIFQLIKQQKPSLLVTLHESIEFHSRNPKRYGQTLCYDFADQSPFMQSVLARVNPQISNRRDKLAVFVEAHPTCPTYQTAATLHIPATSIETCRQLPLDLRIRYQLTTLEGFFDKMGLGYQQTDVARLP